MDHTLTIHGGQLTEHFNLWEFAHQSGNEIYIDNAFMFAFVPALEDFRRWYNRAINITSCYRPPAYNAIVGGSKNSMHLKSRAVDFPYPREYFSFSDSRKKQFLENVKIKWVEVCHARGYGAQVNFYDNRFHLGMAASDNFLDLRGK